MKEIKPHKKVEPNDGVVLLRTLDEHGITTLPENAIEWRLCKGQAGWLKGLNMKVRLIATDGVVAWALTGNDKAFFCHLSNFEKEAKERKPKANKGAESKERSARPLAPKVVAALSED